MRHKSESRRTLPDRQVAGHVSERSDSAACDIRKVRLKEVEKRGAPIMQAWLESALRKPITHWVKHET